jgi:signal transduction histidine kinase
VVLNLLVNAMEAMSGMEEGRRQLLVSTNKITDKKDPASATGSSADKSSYVSVEVRDSGPGLLSGSLAQLFTAFYTTKPHGLGMGLAVSRSIIEAHGGRLEAFPNDGGGATFQFTLPLVRG